MGKSVSILLFLLILCPALSWGQFRPAGNSSTRTSNIEQEIDDGLGENKVDSQKERVDIKIRIWNLTGDGSFMNPLKLDTLQKGFQIFNPIYKNAITNTYTGNYGGAHLNNNYFNRNYGTDFYFLRNHDAYLLTPERLNYFNTTTPYTLFDYSQSENQNTQNETRFNVIHSQNVNEFFNVTFRYDQAKSDGQYNYQANKNSSISLYSSYNKDAFSIHGGFISNVIRNEENGGIQKDADLSEKDQTNILFNLVNAKSEYKNNYFFLNSEYKIGKNITVIDSTINGEQAETKRFRPLIGLIYKFELQNNERVYKEEDGANIDYFENIYMDSTGTLESVGFNKVANVFQIKQYENADRKTSFGKRVFLGLDFDKTIIPRSGDRPPNSDSYTNIFIGGGIFREKGKFWTWNFDGKLYTVGYKSGQTELNGIISKPIKLFRDSMATMEISGNLQTLVPDYFIETFYSNHFKWSNSTYKNEQMMNAKFVFSSPKYNLQTGAHYSLINNFIYHSESGLPAQTSDELLILGAFIKKEIQLKNFDITAHMLVQKASDDKYIHLPDFSAFVSLNYNFVWSKVLFTQLGADMRYNTAFYADAYNPSTGLFYLQNEKEIGNYPYIDAYVNMKLKRTRVFFKWINVASDFLGDNYFGALHHPMNRRTFRLGVAWTWYD